MDQREWLAGQFETHRSHLKTVAYRMLGSASEADDAVQESWIRLSRSDTSGVENLGGWLTTVVARVSLDMLRARSSRREEPLDGQLPDFIANGADPAQEALLADSVGLAMLVVLETLSPAERVAFVLHDMFAVPYEEIAPIVGRSPTAARKLASRARSRVQGDVTVVADRRRQREVVEAFLAASRGGDFDALLALLDPDVLLKADAAAVEMGSSKGERGAMAVATTFAGRARAAQPVLVNGLAGLVWSMAGRPKVFFQFEIKAGQIVEIQLIADPDRLRGLDMTMLDQ